MTETGPHRVLIVSEVPLPAVDIVVLSGSLEAEFIVSLERLDIHDVFKLPCDLEAVAERIVELIVATKPVLRATRP